MGGVYDYMSENLRPDLGITIEVLCACLIQLNTYHMRNTDPAIIKKTFDLIFLWDIVQVLEVMKW